MLTLFVTSKEFFSLTININNLNKKNNEKIITFCCCSSSIWCKRTNFDTYMES